MNIALETPLRRSERRKQLGTSSIGAARRDIQPRGAEPCSRELKRRYTANVDALGTLRILEAVRVCGLADQSRIYQASTSELCKQYKKFLSGNYPISPKKSLWRGQALRLLDAVNYRGLRDVCLQWNFI